MNGIAAAKCMDCPGIPTRGLHCDKCRERRANTAKQRRSRRVLAGRCPDCNAPAAKDRTRCQRCLTRSNRAERELRIRVYTERLPAKWLGTQEHFYEAVKSGDERVLDEVVRFALQWVIITKRARDKVIRLQKEAAGKERTNVNDN